MNSPLVWLVDDSRDFLEINKDILEDKGLRVDTYDSIKSFHEAILLALDARIERPDLLILDYNFNHEGNILSFLKNNFKDGLKVPFFICSSLYDDEMFENFFKLGGVYNTEGIASKGDSTGFIDGTLPDHLEKNILITLKLQRSSMVHFKYKHNLSSINIKFDNLLQLFLENSGTPLPMEKLQEAYCVTPKTMIKELTALRKHIFSTGHDIKHFRKEGGYKLTAIGSSCG